MTHDFIREKKKIEFSHIKIISFFKMSSMATPAFCKEKKIIINGQKEILTQKIRELNNFMTMKIDNSTVTSICPAYNALIQERLKNIEDCLRIMLIESNRLPGAPAPPASQPAAKPKAIKNQSPEEESAAEADEGDKK